jgi:cytochrome c
MERDMFDTMTMTKIVGGFCGAFLVFLLGGWAAESLYHIGGGHGDEHAAAYPIEVDGDDHGGEVEEGPDFATLLASADAERGERVFGKCKACHSVEEGAHGTGPSLFRIVDRDIAAIDGYAYSGTVAGLEGNWTADELNAFLESPKGYAPGTKMTFNGLGKVEDRANLVAYLQTLTN